MTIGELQTTSVFEANARTELTTPLQLGYDGAELMAAPDGMPPKLTAFEGLAKIQFDSGWTSGSTSFEEKGATRPDGDED